MNEQTISQVEEMLTEEFGEETLQQIQEAVHKMSILIGVANCGSIEKGTLCEQIYNDKMRTIPLPIIESVYDRYILEMVGDSILLSDTNVPSINPDVLPHVHQYMEQLEAS